MDEMLIFFKIIVRSPNNLHRNFQNYRYMPLKAKTYYKDNALQNKSKCDVIEGMIDLREQKSYSSAPVSTFV